jgi:predicted enzyme related to lactoylglutathione lyase
VPAHWLAYVTVEAVDETAARAASLGGRIVALPFDVPGVGRVAVLVDPLGATIGLFKPPSSKPQA